MAYATQFSYTMPTYDPSSVWMGDLAGYGQTDAVNQNFNNLATQASQRLRSGGWGNTITSRTSALAGVERQRALALSQANEQAQGFLAQQRSQRAAAQYQAGMSGAQLGMQYGNSLAQQSDAVDRNRLAGYQMDLQQAALQNQQQAAYQPYQLGQYNRARNQMYGYGG